MAEDNTHDHNGEGEEPIRFSDKRRVDPETGRLRDSESQNEGQDAAEGAGSEGLNSEDAEQVQDPLEQAEQIFREMPAEEGDVVDEQGQFEQGHPGASGEAAEGDIPEGEAAEQSASAEEREAELQADLQRLQAEYVNYRRRVERDRGLEKDRVTGELISELMPVLDDIAAARGAGDLEDGPFAHIAQRLESVLAQQGLETVGKIGEPFDPNVHEAIMQQPHEEVEADHIAVVVRAGYRYGDRLLRAAQVIVSAGQQD